MGVPWGQVQEFGIYPVDWPFPKASLELESSGMAHKRAPRPDNLGTRHAASLSLESSHSIIT